MSAQPHSFIWQFPDLICSVNQEPSHTNAVLLNKRKFPDLICLANQESSCPKVVFIWAYICCLLIVNSLILFLWSSPICSVHQEPSRQRLSFMWPYMCSTLREHKGCVKQTRLHEILTITDFKVLYRKKYFFLTTSVHFRNNFELIQNAFFMEVENK